jgi:serine protease Do
VLGTLIKIDGLVGKGALKSKSFLISKSSVLSDIVKVELAPDRIVKAKVVSRDAATDLALLQIDEQIEEGVDLNKASEDVVKFSELGKLLASPRPGQTTLLSIISNMPLSIPRVKSGAYIGLSANSLGGKLLVAGVQDGGPAKRASVFRGDELLSINGKPLLTEEELNDEIDSYVSNDTISLQVIRDGKQFEKRVAIKIREQSAEEMHIAYHFADGRSDRRSDFTNVMIHDARLKPMECGGPLYGFDGQFYGINIARFSRTSSLAIPAVTICEFVKNALLSINKN